MVQTPVEVLGRRRAALGGGDAGLHAECRWYGEDARTGRVSVLEDKNVDGRMDQSTVFLDDLQMPRR